MEILAPPNETTLTIEQVPELAREAVDRADAAEAQLRAGGSAPPSAARQCFQVVLQCCNSSSRTGTKCDKRSGILSQWRIARGPKTRSADLHRTERYTPTLK